MFCDRGVCVCVCVCVQILKYRSLCDFPHAPDPVQIRAVETWFDEYKDLPMILHPILSATTPSQVLCPFL